MANKSIVIVGAGLAGLATGCYGQMNGYNTKIFEMQDKPGGVCVSWKIQDLCKQDGKKFQTTIKN